MPLHLAVMNNHGDIVDLLLDKGAHLDVPRYPDFKKALHLAAEKNYGGLVRKLLAAGASPYLLDTSDKTARDLAVENQAHEVLAEFDKAAKS